MRLKEHKKRKKKTFVNIDMLMEYLYAELASIKAELIEEGILRAA